jgi:hypothetical protein
LSQTLDPHKYKHLTNLQSGLQPACCRKEECYRKAVENGTIIPETPVNNGVISPTHKMPSSQTETTDTAQTQTQSKATAAVKDQPRCEVDLETPWQKAVRRLMACLGFRK